MALSRRTLVATAAALPFAATLPCASARAASPVTVQVDAAKVLAKIPADYMGLGFEISSVAVPGLLSAANQAYVKLVQGLGRDGVIRIGGNTADFARYDAHGQAVSAPKASVVTEANLHELKSFVDAVGWKLIWCLNLGDDKLDNAVEEARAVSAIMDDRLLAFEIGNEPDLFPRSGHRGADYGYPAWFAEYRRYKAAIRAVLPHAAFAGPDLAGATDWMDQFARDERDAALLTVHHYITGQADPAATIQTMLSANTRYDPVLARFQQAATAAGKPWRMCETASFSGGGKAGVSDSYVSALWALDYLFVLAAHGCAGVNMETGVNHLGWISHYTPIRDDLHGGYAPAPEYYGLRAFAHAGKGELIATACDAGAINCTAYATRESGRVCVAIINKDTSQNADVAIKGVGAARAEVMRLTGPSLTAKDGVQLGSGKREAVHALHVPAASAALVWLEN